MKDTNGVLETHTDDGVMSSDGRSHAERLAADAELLEALRANNFEGAEWNQFKNRIVDYSLPVLRAWLLSKEVFRSLRSLEIRLPYVPSDRHWTLEVTGELAGETVARALPAFEKSLRLGRWSPEGKATLTTYFIRQCLFKFSDVYRMWLRESKPLPLEESVVPGSFTMHDEPRLDGHGLGDNADPAERVMARMEAREALRRVADDRTRAVLLLGGAGYSQVEIADLIGSSPKAVEMLLYRHRQRMRRHSDDQR